MFYRILRWSAAFFLGRYFRRQWVFNGDRVPRSGPLIVASNHPSAFLEASLLATIMTRPLHFLVRGDMFHPRFRWLFDWTNQIPIYRQKDGIANLRKNASSFDLTYRKLGEGHAVLIFPEAKTLLEKRLRPIQRGTAHLAFGALPFIPDGQVLTVLPVGINFTEPRQPGTDVVVRFGEPFVVQAGTREDRNAIEDFTSQLEQAMKPLVVNVEEPGNEPHYNVLVSVYFKFMAEAAGERVAVDVDRIAALVNSRALHADLLRHVHEHERQLKQAGMREAVFYPGILTASRVFLLAQLALKATWWLAGGWVWRTLRGVIFSKIKAPTFQTPTSIGAGLVVFSVLTVLLFGLTLALDWVLWLPWAWLAIMRIGEWVPAPLALTWRAVLLPGRVRRVVQKNIGAFRNALREELAR